MGKNLENNREEMQNTIIRALGMEHPATVWFCGLCEEYADNEWNNKCLYGLMSALLDLVQFASELE
jgi:hypothetical protein